MLLLVLSLLFVGSCNCGNRRACGQESRLEAERNHAEGMAALHLRTIEALALAIEAKDHSTHEHLRRVQVYAMSIGNEMGLSEAELDALRAAAVLHDIGKLAVPATHHLQAWAADSRRIRAHEDPS